MDPAPTEISTLSLHDALPISRRRRTVRGRMTSVFRLLVVATKKVCDRPDEGGMVLDGAVKNQDRKSTRLNSSHLGISYAVFCLKKKKKSHAKSRPATAATTLR